MGTSTSYTAPPNWGGNKSTLTRHSGQSLGANGVADFVRNHIDNNGGARKTASGGGTLGSGAAAKKTASRVGGLFSDILRYGFDGALRRNDDLKHLIGKPVKDVFRAIQDLWDVPGNSMDAADSRAALMDLFEEIEKGVETEDIEKVLQQKTTFDFITRYFGFYIFEQIRRVHYEDEIRNQIDDNPERHFNEIKDYIQYKIKSVTFDRDVESIDWFGSGGRAIVNQVIKSVLEVFQK